VIVYVPAVACVGERTITLDDVTEATIASFDRPAENARDPMIEERNGVPEDAVNVNLSAASVPVTEPGPPTSAKEPVVVVKSEL
jgi:hypothetical protein